MGAPCDEHEHIIKVVRYGRVYSRKMPDCFSHNIRTDAPAGWPPPPTYLSFFLMACGE